MAKNREKLARLLGAKMVGQVPDVGGGAFGMARLAHVMHERLTPSQGERPGSTEREERRAETPGDENNHALAALRYLVSRLDERSLGRSGSPAVKEEPAVEAERKERRWLSVHNE